MNTKTWLAVGAGAVVLFWLWRTKWGGDTQDAVVPDPNALPSAPMIPMIMPQAAPTPIPSAAARSFSARPDRRSGAFQNTTNNQSTSEPTLTQPAPDNEPLGPASPVQMQFNTSRSDLPAASIRAGSMVAQRSIAAEAVIDPTPTIVGVNGIGNLFFG